MSTPSVNITALLDRARSGDPGATGELVAALYDRFLRQARWRLRGERDGHTMGTADLTHEALMRLLKGDELAKAQNRNHLFRAYARALGQALIDYSRRPKPITYGRPREELDDLIADIRQRSACDVVTLDDALAALRKEDENAAEVLWMDFYADFTRAEIAAALGVSLSTVDRDKRFGLAWLGERLEPESAP